MLDWYFPQSVHEEAHMNYILKTGCDPEELRAYCLKNIEFFFDVSFAHVEGIAPPRMKK